MSKFSTIHIFGYGETQIIGKELNFKTRTTDLSHVQALLDDVKSKRPQEVEETAYHVVHVHEGLKIDFLSTEKGKGFSVKWSNVNTALTDALADELIALKG